jgi:hypothetical protein
MLKSALVAVVCGIVIFNSGWAFAQSCPQNSRATSYGCACNAGYVMSGGRCVPR